MTNDEDFKSTKIVLTARMNEKIGRTLEEHRKRAQLASSGYQPKAKLLFWGAPGCGKTYTAFYLAHELGLPVGVVRLNALVSSFLGDTKCPKSGESRKGMRVRISVRRLPHLFLLLCFCAGFAGISHAQGAGPRTSMSAQEPQARLELTTSVLEQRYCPGGDLRLKLRLHFVNTGERPIILHRYGHTPHLSYVSQSAAEALAGKYRVRMHYSASFLRLTPLPDEAEPGDEFVTLKPGDAYDGDAVVHLALLPSEKGAKDDLPPGDYALRVVIQTWYGSSEKAEELRTRWSRYGLFWSGEVKSQPMPFRIESRPLVEDCK